jgi:predicted nucleic acid-binding protein
MPVLDTSALSGAMRGDPLALAHARAERPGDLFLVPPVAAEIHYGIARLPSGSRRSQLLRGEYGRWRAMLRWLDWGEESCAIFGEQKARLEARGTRLDDMDLAVAAIALAYGLGVATCNARHFSRIESLRVLDWSKAPRS